MLTRTLVTLTLLLIPAIGAERVHPPAARPDRPRHARLVDDDEGCRVPPPAPEPVAPATRNDQGRP
jgi:hypothetical protein